MKKIAILLLAILTFSCSDDDEKGTVEDKGQWAMIFNETVKSDSNPVDRTEKFMFDGERLIQHIIKQRYFEEEISNEVNLSYSDNQVTVTTDYLTLVYTLNSEGYASQCVYSLSSQNRIYQFSYSAEGYLTGIVENIDDTEYSSTSLTYESELLTRLGTVGKKEINKVYDPACGSGSLLLKAEKVLGRDAVRNGFFGQEINITTYNLCRINMFLHDIEFDKFDIACEDTLTNPQHWDDEPFELIVSNPPYSIKWAGDENPLLINDPRFAPAGVLAPKSKADLAFIMHSLAWLASNGTAAIVCFPGIMYRGGAEQKIRKYLVDNNFIDCIIQLPSNLFFGTSIATCIMVLKKGKTDNKVLFIDASSECVKVTNNNKLTPENINKIVDTFAQRAEEAHFSHLAEYSEVQENDYNLSVSTYVEAKDTREKIDIVKLNAEIAQIVARENELRAAIDQIVAEIEG